jgi:hypothetical protein
VRKILCLDSRPAQTVADALEEFEAEFHYPLGKDRWFSISHGDDYTRFFRAVGDARCFVAQQDERVTGAVSVARCQLRGPDGAVVEAAYFSDLKVAGSSCGPTLLRLLRDSVAWARRTPTTPGFSIVMDGTARDPTSYTGRLGIPQYVELAKLMILRIPSDIFVDHCDSIDSSLAEVRDCYRGLTRNHFSTDGGNTATRSRMNATGMILGDGGACGILEDTRRCKLLFRDDGSEMISAHLSSFGYRREKDAVNLFKSAALRCREMGLPALFVSLPLSQSEAVLELLPQDDIVKAPATVFGFGLPPGENWSVNTSEI